MKQRLMFLGAAGLLAVVLGVGYAASVGPDRPTHPPSLNATEVYVAGPDGNALKCNGKLVKVSRSDLGGRTPTLTPEQAARQSVVTQARPQVARCEKGPAGKETGRVVLVDEATADTP